MKMKNAYYRLESYYKSNATESEKKVIHYILTNPIETAYMDIHSLANITYCSSATIVRVCKKNGFTGFKELKLSLLNDFNYADQLSKANLENKESGLSHTIKKVLNENIRAINNTYNLLDFEIIRKVATLIRDSDIVYLFGIGASFLVAKDFQQKLERVNKRTALFEDTHMQLINSTNVSPKEIAIVISYSGITPEIIRYAENIKAASCPLVAVTKFGSSRLISMSDYNLFVPEIEAPLRISASSSRISQLCVVDVLYNAYLDVVGDTPISRIIYTNKLLDKKVDKS